MQTGIREHDGERWQLAYDNFDGMLYRETRSTPNGPLQREALHKCRVVDGLSLDIAWRDYLAFQRGEGQRYMVMGDPKTRAILFPNEGEK